MDALCAMVQIVYLVGKISKFWKTWKVDGLNFGLRQKKIFFEWMMMACYFVWRDTFCNNVAFESIAWNLSFDYHLFVG